MERKRLYVSLPITGKDLEKVKRHAKKVKGIWEERGYNVVTPFELVEEDNGERDPLDYYAYCMGKCVEALLMCDGIVMCKGCFDSKGCRTEYSVAEIYRLDRMIDNTDYEED